MDGNYQCRNIASRFETPVADYKSLILSKLGCRYRGKFDIIAQMAELVDALDSKSGYRKVVQVRFLFWAHEKKRL